MKKLMLMSFVMTLVALANASELWWTIGDDTSEVADWTTARLCYATGENFGYNFAGNQIGNLTYSKDLVSNLDYIVTDISGYQSAAYSFFLELCDAEGNRLAASSVSIGSPNKGSAGYSESSIQQALYEAGMSTANPTPYSFGGFTTSQVVPEPTSGLLMLIGLAGLALRRRRA